MPATKKFLAMFDPFNNLHIYNLNLNPSHIHRYGNQSINYVIMFLVTLENIHTKTLKLSIMVDEDMYMCVKKECFCFNPTKQVRGGVTSHSRWTFKHGDLSSWGPSLDHCGVTPTTIQITSLSVGLGSTPRLTNL